MRQEDILKSRIDILADWNANPADRRTAKDLAEFFGITTQGLRDYVRAHNQEISYATDQKRKKFIPEVATASMKALFDQIEKKNMKAIEIGLTISGLYTPRSEVTQTTRSDSEVRARVEALLERYKKQESKVDAGNSPTPTQPEKS